MAYNITRRTALAGLACCLIVGATGAAFSPSHAMAQEWPSNTITFIAPFPPGGTSDANSRIMAEALSKRLGQTVVVENRPGANGNIGLSLLSRAKPDGYTIGLTGVGSNAINPSLYAKMPFDSVKDFTHITLFAAGPNILVVNPQFPAKTFKEFIELIKANPGKYNFASSGNGASGHLAMEMLKVRAGLDIKHIPYKGGGPAITDVLGGQVPMMFINQDAVLSHIQAGRLHVLAVASPERNSLYPNAPTIAESGYPGFSAVSWTGLSAPAGLPQEIVDRLHKEMVAVLADPTLRQSLESKGYIVGGNTPQEYTDFITSEIKNWEAAAKASGATVN
ncbi:MULTISPECIES: Bug family tripartite tricarboxylate transporter substrate binding protein [Agrobacterium]|uniref:Bug family tripartite tricarboxylate transporter substrate binding protein n=1 Tax=Agrobacterium tumefaciens TaxID=358 RepID=UPI000EF1D3DA|nr:hypothetical protein At1D1108_51170 [Agrobacterium tumefaciens]NSY09856.1 tripartite tricarboxylate transporter substrate binding protein [Agrobacterium tumefaciens]NSY93452.1 tripartite tricarboxylate transporter substrate binding protein [Agrobacterium tumefaciens]